MMLVNVLDLAQDRSVGGAAALEFKWQADQVVLLTTEAWRSMTVETVVVHGSEGAFAAEESGVLEKAVYPLEVVDTVGARDAFVAGLLSRRLRGRSAGECLYLGNAYGGCTGGPEGATHAGESARAAVRPSYWCRTLERGEIE